MTGRGIMSSVLGMILQRGGTIKLSIELPVATRHRRDMIENLLKAIINSNKDKQQQNKPVASKKKKKRLPTHHYNLMLICKTEYYISIASS